MHACTRMCARGVGTHTPQGGAVRLQAGARGGADSGTGPLAWAHGGTAATGKGGGEVRVGWKGLRRCLSGQLRLCVCLGSCGCGRGEMSSVQVCFMFIQSGPLLLIRDPIPSTDT